MTKLMIINRSIIIEHLHLSQQAEVQIGKLIQWLDSVKESTTASIAELIHKNNKEII